MAFIDRKKFEGDLNGFIGKGTEVEGTIRFSDLFRVDGKISGKVVSKKDLVVGEAAEVDAEVDVGTLSVAGKVSGKITISERLEIHPGGRVSGELHMKTPKLIINDGAVFEGSIDMGGAARAEQRPDPVPETGKVKGFPARGQGARPR